ncbi:MAG TPA: hypothetical protein VEL28_03795 [Candidatus Binatia bacterium]|nr:hypothetical protein [Candidatus Binatia bacterium]
MSGPIWYHVKSSFLAAAAAIFLFPAAQALAANGDCSQPATNGPNPTASDCAYILRSAVGLEDCELCVCDTNGSQSKTAADALTCLRKAVGANVNLNCPSCGPTTTTDGPGDSSTSTTSTTSTSTTSTTTTLAVLCDSNADCDGLPAAFRCNPNNGFCERPCDNDNDCRDFYECNQNTDFCQQPALLF